MFGFMPSKLVMAITGSTPFPQVQEQEVDVHCTVAEPQLSAVFPTDLGAVSSAGSWAEHGGGTGKTNKHSLDKGLNFGCNCVHME